MAETKQEAERKKRTRPVSACENCRSKKVKCHLLPDRPVCKGCATSGAECLFRIDDLAPSLRRERFAEYVVTEPLPETLERPQRQRRRKLSASDPERTTSDGGSSISGADGHDAKPIKRKAVFRSFANPTKLGAPSLPRQSQTHLSSPSPSSPSLEQIQHNRAVASSPHTSYAANDARYAHRLGSMHATGMHNDSHASQSRHQMYDGMQISNSGHWQQHHAPSKPYSVDRHSLYDDRTSPARQHAPHHVMTAPSVSTLRTSYRIAPFPYAPDVQGEQISDDRLRQSSFTDHKSHHPAYGRTRQSHSSTSSDSLPWNARPSHSVDIPLIHQAHAPDTLWPQSTGPAPIASFENNDVDGRVPSMPIAQHADVASTSHFSAAKSPTPERNDLADASRDDSEQKSDFSSHQAVKQHHSDATLPSTNDRKGSEQSLGNNMRPPATFKKIALPFFRWFGATANTPGIRRIKIGVYHDTEADPQEDLIEAADDHSKTLVSTSQTLHSPIESAAAPVMSSSAAHSTLSAAAAPLQQHSASTKAQASPSSHFACTTTGPAHHPSVADSVLSSSARELFESNRPRYPRADILLHLVELFLKYFKASCFPWLDEKDLLASARSGELPAILANAICAMTARFSAHVDLRSAKNASESFSDMTKILVVPMLSWPSIDVIEALVILSYAEFGAGADAGLWMYVGMALRMATDLGLQHELTIKSMGVKKHQDRARYLFWAIVSLDRITCFGTGRPVTIRDDSYNCNLPALEEDPTADGFVFGHIVRTLLKRGQIGELLNRRDDGLTLEQRGALLRNSWLDLANYYETLPSDLHFGVNTFRKLAAADKGCAFVYLHVLLQSTISLLNRPSLLRKFDRDFSITAPSRLATIANHASGTIVSILRFATDAGQHQARLKDEHADVNPYIDCNPYLDQLILPAGRAFLSEREAAKDMLRSFGHSASVSRPASRQDDGSSMHSKSSHTDLFEGLQTRRQYAQTNIATCQESLDRVAQWWSGARWPARALRQEAEGASSANIGPDGTDEEAQPAPIRDVEMVLRWARARRIRARQSTPTPARRYRDIFNAKTSESRTDLMQKEGYDMQLDLSRGQRMSEKGELSKASQSDTSTLGLGFSGSLGAGAEFDLDVLIDAWAQELDTIESSAAVQGENAGTARGLAEAGGPTTSLYVSSAHPVVIPMQQRTPVSQSTPASRLPLESRAHVTSSLGTPAETVAIRDNGDDSVALASAVGSYDQPTWLSGMQRGAMDIDMSAMQFEEFFFDSPANMGSVGGTSSHSFGTNDPFDRNTYVGATDGLANQATRLQQTSNVAAATQTTPSIMTIQNEDENVHATSQKSYASVVTSMDERPSSNMGVHQDLDMLPAALLNAFNFPPGASTSSSPAFPLPNDQQSYLPSNGSENARHAQQHTLPAHLHTNSQAPK